MSKAKIVIDGIELRCTCPSNPEQYDAYLDGKQVGYLRLRHGVFSVDCPECGGETMLETEDCRGDGVFERAERYLFLREAVVAIRRWIKQQEQP